MMTEEQANMQSTDSIMGTSMATSPGTTGMLMCSVQFSLAVMVYNYTHYQ